MKMICLLLGMVCVGVLYGQDTVLTHRIYLSPQEVIDRAPSDTMTVLKLIHRKKSDLKMNGGNDYKLEGWTPEETASEYVRNRIWAVEYEDTLYVNGYHVSCTAGFAQVESRGDRYLLFYSALPVKRQVAQEIGLKKAYQRQQSSTAAVAGAFGLLGMAFSKAANGAGNLNRYPMLYDLTREKAYYPEIENVQLLTEEVPELQAKYADWEIDSVKKADVIGLTEALNRVHRPEP